jgi:hypothetical protein
LKAVDTVIKDAKYRGKSVSRKHLFQGLEDIDDNSEEEVQERENEEDQITASDHGEEEAEMSDKETSSVSSGEGPHTSSVLSDTSETERDSDAEDEDQQKRREEVRQLLDQEQMYFFCLLYNLTLTQGLLHNNCHSHPK